MGSPYVQVSLDGSRNVEIRINVDQGNKAGLGELFDDIDCLNLKHTSCYVAPIISLAKSCASYQPLCIDVEKFSEFGDELYNKFPIIGLARPSPRYGCMFETDNRFAIDPYLHLYKCIAMAGDERHKVGFIDENGRAHLNNRFYEAMKRNPLDFEKCRECEVLPICGGGYAALVYDKYGAYQAVYCETRKQMLNERIRSYVMSNYSEEIASASASASASGR